MNFASDSSTMSGTHSGSSHVSGEVSSFPFLRFIVPSFIITAICVDQCLDSIFIGG